MENIIKKIKQDYPVSDQSIDLLVPCLKPHRFPKKYQLIKEGIYCKVAYFIEKGMTRSYWLVDGAKEEEENKVSVRSRYLGDEGAKDLADFIGAIKEEIKNKTIRKIEVEN